jgi:hypothetical protein
MKNHIKRFNESGDTNIKVSAEDIWYGKTGRNINQEEIDAMIEFAKIHCKLQLDNILKQVKTTLVLDNCPETGISNYTKEIDRDSIKNAYPLSNIK